jgi:hypothetical protein
MCCGRGGVGLGGVIQSVFQDQCFPSLFRTRCVPLSHVQEMHPQKRVLPPHHIGMESRGWEGAFNVEMELNRLRSVRPPFSLLLLSAL